MPREADRALAPPGAARRDRIYGRLDPVVSMLARWADESPEAMRRLLTEGELRAQLLAALDAVVPDAGEGDASASVQAGT